MRKALIVIAALVIASPAPALAQTATPPKAATASPKTSAKTWDMVAGSWKRVKGSVKRQWGKLTKNDIAEANGRRDILAGKIQQRYGIDKAKADAQIDEWLKGQK